jgi:hypothetical protein
MSIFAIFLICFVGFVVQLLSIDDRKIMGRN